LAGALAGFLFPWRRRAREHHARDRDPIYGWPYIVYRWGEWPRERHFRTGKLMPDRSVGWIQCQFNELKKGDTVLLFSSDPKEYDRVRDQAKLCAVFRVERDAYRRPEDGRWTAESSQVEVGQARNITDIDRLEFAFEQRPYKLGPDDGRLAGCAGSRRRIENIPEHIPVGPFSTKGKQGVIVVSDGGRIENAVLLNCTVHVTREMAPLNGQRQPAAIVRNVTTHWG
jgi:hypothetical protein